MHLLFGNDNRIFYRVGSTKISWLLLERVGCSQSLGCEFASNKNYSFTKKCIYLLKSMSPCTEKKALFFNLILIRVPR